MQNIGSHQYKLWVYIFLNKRGLFQSLVNQGQPQTAKKLDLFIVGFNQAAERFSMIDVGWAKEAADVKIKSRCSSLSLGHPAHRVETVISLFRGRNKNVPDLQDFFRR
jgi:hypothetical protein